MRLTYCRAERTGRGTDGDDDGRAVFRIVTRPWTAPLRTRVANAPTGRPVDRVLGWLGCADPG